MTREQYEAMRARLAEISYYEPAVIDGIAEQALEGAKELLARVEALEAENVALRARAVPEVVWQDLAPELGGCAESIAKSGEFALVVYRWGDERAYSIRVDETRIRGSMPKAVSLADCKSACKAAFLRLVGVK